MDGAVAGGLVGALRVCGRVVDGWTGDMCGCVGEMGGAVVAVGMVDDEGGGGDCGALYPRGLCRWRSRLVARVCVSVCTCLGMCVCACTCLAAYLQGSPTRVPRGCMRWAGQVGGIAPLPDSGLMPIPESSGVADAALGHYSMLCRELCVIEPRPELPEWCGDGFAILQTMGVYDISHVVCAALAAADCARAAEEHVANPPVYPSWVHAYGDVVGGGRGQGDTVTDWIQNRLHAMWEKDQMLPLV